MFFTRFVDNFSGAKILNFFILRYKNVLNSEKKIRIVMAVTNDLVTDRRVLRHSATLREAGYEVVLIGRNNLNMKHRKKWKFYAEYNHRLFHRLLRTKTDIIWANDTDTLPACWLAARLKGQKLVMDSHEIFPEVPELVDRPRVKHVWELIERLLLPRCDANLTVCQSLADYYKKKFGIDMTVVRNIGLTPNPSPKGEGGSFTHASPLSLRRGVGGEAGEACLLYQGAVNLGRGIDWAIDAMEQLPDCRLVIAGVGDLYDEMRAYAAAKPWHDRITFLGRVTPDELEQLTPQADVGLVMLEDMGLNYHYSLPNRIGDFVAAGVPMVVSDLPEMAAVVRKFGIGEILNGIGPEALVAAVKKVLARQWTEADFAEARADMDWNNEKEKLYGICKFENS
jgi:glycosyltransferase involved in cell wall biosynthesis